MKTVYGKRGDDRLRSMSPQDGRQAMKTKTIVVYGERGDTKFPCVITTKESMDTQSDMLLFDLDDPVCLESFEAVSWGHAMTYYLGKYFQELYVCPDERVWEPFDDGSAGAAEEPADLDTRIRKLVEDGRVREARSIAGGTKWERVLAPAVVKPGARATGRGDLVLNVQWIREHGPRFRGRWVALRDGRLLADAGSHAELLHLLAIKDDVGDASILELG